MNQKSIPLNLSSEDAQILLAEIAQKIAYFMSTIHDQPVQNLEKFNSEADWLKDKIPELPSNSQSILDFIFNEIIPPAMNPASPGYLAYVPGGGLFSSAIAEFIAAVVNRYTGMWESAPAAVELETQALRWLAELIGLPKGTLGLFTSGGSMSTLIAMVAARDKYLGNQLLRGTVYYSSQAHYAITKAVQVAAIPRENLRPIPVDSQFRLRIDFLEQAIQKDKEAGLLPFFVCGTVGTVNTGAIDPLERIAQLAAKYQLWFHIDGAYGAVFYLVSELQSLFKGMEQADSVTVDPHKGLFLAYGTGVLFVKNMEDLRRVFEISAAYLPDPQKDNTHLDFRELSPELSRDWRGLRLWFPFKLHGVGVFRQALAEKRRLAVWAWERLSLESDIEIVTPPELSLFAFRQRFNHINQINENNQNRKLLALINQSKKIMLSGTELNGQFFLRICILHLRTQQSTLEEGLKIIQEAIKKMRVQN
ncbi:pyridoxal phosphate-dependent decarboxylase family protein [Candidatus Nitrosacidococcus sp. I8]|uniref:pyridoxal phosphate-dependent decarboxylase family protein n=1 Tax=Candidatus Nitrosacidococcus sp. I8 TaxID=2942908 RepID=UPI002227A601|nr:aminotransferase class V-fold PLP-dependent enzyme [Candidatus Nitrosacidococcus sp. I8]CAH9014985.1 Tryptophan decarboxylase [Candidatus Nitrosacidococcus sp. I8]